MSTLWSYNSRIKYCSKGRSVDYRSFVQYECDKALEAGIKIVVLYNSTYINKEKCPECLREKGIHRAMMKSIDGEYDWDYSSVKKAIEN